MRIVETHSQFLASIRIFISITPLVICTEHNYNIIMLHIFTGRYIARYTIGQSQRISPLECAEHCNATPRCLGFNYYKNNGK